MPSLLTVVTVVRNDPIGLEPTISSVASQDYPQIEYIVVDGGSTEETVNRPAAWTRDVSLWISEPDSGIDEAMNRAFAWHPVNISAS